ncbi:MAG: SufS family cysteine desulfurase [Myxococcota bacterium]
MARFDVDALRSEFPGLHQHVHGKPLIYADSAATAQKPKAVLAALYEANALLAANVHRGVHELSRRATAQYEGARDIIATFLGGVPREEVVFTRGATEALNLLAYGLQTRLSVGDEVLVTGMEHHANLVPWQLACARSGATLRHIPVTDEGALDLAAAPWSPATKVVGVVHASNTLGTINPIAQIAAKAHEHGAIVVVDGAQWVPHGPTDPVALGADAYVFSGHKLYGPTGIGVLWARTSLLESLPVWQGGGDMIRSVTLTESTFADLPHRFEAGTPPIAQAIGLAAAIEWVQGVGWEELGEHEAQLTDALDAMLAALPQVRRIGTHRPRVSLASFVFDGIHAHDVGSIVDTEGVALRTGHHCTEPLMDRFDVPATTRISLAAYNTFDEIERIGRALRTVLDVLA